MGMFTYLIVDWHRQIIVIKTMANHDMRAQPDDHADQDQDDVIAQNQSKSPDTTAYEKHHAMEHIKKDAGKLFLLVRQSFR